MCAFWSFGNNRLERLNRHCGSFCSTQPPVHSHQQNLRPSVWPPQTDRAWRDDDKRERGRAAQLGRGRKTIWAKGFYFVIGAAREFAVTALHLLASAKDDGPLMSFTVIQLSQCDWLVTALSLNISIMLRLGCISKLPDFNLNAFLLLDALLTEVSIFRFMSQCFTRFSSKCNHACKRTVRQKTGCFFELTFVEAVQFALVTRSFLKYQLWHRKSMILRVHRAEPEPQVLTLTSHTKRLYFSLYKMV